MSSVIVEGVETMLLGLASGVLTGVACLAAWKGPRRRASGGGMLDPSHDLDPEPCKGSAESGPHVTRERESSLAGAVPLFPAGPLEQAGDFIQKIRSARAAAATSVAEFKHLLETQELTEDASAEEMLQQQLSLLEADLMSAEVSTTGRTLGASHVQNPTLQGRSNVAQCSGIQQAANTSVAAAAASGDGGDVAAENALLQRQLAAAHAELASTGAELLQTHAQLATAKDEHGRMYTLQADLQADVQGLQACITQLTQQLEAAQQGHVAALQHASNLERQAQGLEQQLQQAQQQTDACKQQLHQAQAEVQQAHRQLQQLQAESQLKDQQIAQAHQAHKQELQEAAQLSQQLQQLQQEAELQKEQLVLSHKQLQQLQGEVELQQQARQQAAEQAEQQRQHQQQEAKLQKAQLTLSQQQLQQLQGELEQQKQERQQEAELQEERLLTTQQQLHQLQSEMELQIQQRQQATQQAQQAEQQLQQEAEVQKQQLLLSHKQLQQLQSELEVQEQQQEQACEQAQQAQQRLQIEAELQQEQLLLSRQELHQLQGEFELQKQQWQQAQEQAQEAEQQLQQASLQLQQKDGHLQRLQEDIQSLSKQLKRAAEEAQLQQGRMMEQLQQAQQDALLKGQQLQQAQQDAQGMAQQLQQAQQSMQLVSQQLQQAQQETAQKGQQVIAAQEGAQRQQQLLQQAQQDLAAAQQQLHQTEAEAADSKQQLLKAQADTQNARLLLASTTGAVAAARQQLQDVAAAKLALQTGLIEALRAGEVSYQQLATVAAQVQVLQQQLHQQGVEEKCQQQQQQQQQQRQLTHAEAVAAKQAEMIQELQQKLANLEAQHDPLHTAQACINDMQQQLQAAEAAAQTYQQQLAAAQADLQAQQLAAEATSQEHQQQLGQMQVQVDAAEAQLSEAEQQVQGLQAVAHTRLEMLEELQAQLAHAQQQLQDRDHSPTTEPLSPGLQRQQRQTALIDLPLLRQPPVQGRSYPLPFGVEHDRVHSADSSQQPASQTLLPNASPLLPTHGSHSSKAHTDASGIAAQLPWLTQQGALPIALAVDGPTSSLLAELQHESDELAEQLTQLQQYLKTSTVKYADLNTIEVMDEGLQALRQLNSEVVSVASETVQRVTSAGAAPQSAPTSLAGRAPSRAGTAPKHASCAGILEGSTGLQERGEQFASASAVLPVLHSPAVSRSVALRRLGVELPRLRSWGSEALPDTPLQLPTAEDTANSFSTGRPLSAAAAGSLGGGARSAVLAGDVLTQPAASGLQALAIRLDHWGSDLSEAACSWLTGDAQLQADELAVAASSPQSSLSCFASPSGATAAAAAVRMPSRLAAVSIATVGEPGMLAAWGSGMLPGSGPGTAVLEQQQQQQQPQQVAGFDTLHQLLHSRAAASRAGSLEGQLQAALAEVQQLHGERLVLRSQVAQLAELAAQQEDRLAVNDDLLSALATGWLEGEDEGLEECELY